MDRLWRITADGVYLRPTGQAFSAPGGKAVGWRGIDAYRSAKPILPPECTSTRGEWGEICPDCGNRLPPKAEPIRSWKSVRSVTSKEL